MCAYACMHMHTHTNKPRYTHTLVNIYVLMHTFIVNTSEGYEKVEHPCLHF